MNAGVAACDLLAEHAGKRFGVSFWLAAAAAVAAAAAAAAVAAAAAAVAVWSLISL